MTEPHTGGRPDHSYGISPPTYRLPASTRVGKVVLQVASLERSLGWYRRVLGLSVIDHAPGHAALGPAGGDVLVALRERPGAAPVGGRATLGLFHFAILLPDRATLGRFVTHLSALGEPMGASDHRVSEALYLRDPDGLGVEVYADRPREAWRHRGGQLEMATDPLDLGDLARAGAREAWSGAPREATMGHVHLHVGDLQRAEAFYHERLGLDKMVWSYPGALFLAAGGYHHHLAVNTWASGATTPTEDGAQLVEWELLVPSNDDVRAVLEALDRDPGGTPAVPDPWGTLVRVRAEEAMSEQDPHSLPTT